MAVHAEVVLRPRVCRSQGCQTVFWICSHCDRGQCYCSAACRTEARRRQRRAANRRHQRSLEGRLDHRDRQRAYRQRHAPAGVTDQGSLSVFSPAPFGCGEAITMPVAVSRPCELPGGLEKRSDLWLRCSICGRPSRFVNPFPQISRRTHYAVHCIKDLMRSPFLCREKRPSNDDTSIGSSRIEMPSERLTSHNRDVLRDMEGIMLTEFFESPLRIQELRDGPDGRLLEGFAQELCQAGYAEITARRHIRAAEHLIHWAGRRGKVIAALDEPMIEEFVQHLIRCRCPRYGRTHRRDLRKGARLFLRFARFADIVMTRAVEEIIVDPALLVSFRGWMRQQRATCDATLYNYSLHLRDLLKSLGEDPGRFDAHKLRQFILDTSQRCGWASAKQCTTATVSFCDF